MTTPQDPWPRYAIFDHALKLDRAAAVHYGVENKPTSEWTFDEILLIALETWRRERQQSPQRHDPDTR